MAVINGSQDATALVGIAELVVGVQDVIEGEWWLYVETPADLVGCARCGVRAVGHGRRRTLVRDLAVSGRPVVLVWAKRRWRCPDPDCAMGSWVEQIDAIGPRAARGALRGWAWPGSGRPQGWRRRGRRLRTCMAPALRR